MTHKPPSTVTADDIFQCRQCGDCCTGYGGTYVTPGDIRAIAEFIGEPEETFEEKYCQSSGGRPVLKIGANEKCIFFDDVTQCTIHPVKPKMCRAWPFLETILNAPGNWNLMAQACPGIRTEFSHHDIQECVRKEVEALKKRRQGLDE